MFFLLCFSALLFLFIAACLVVVALLFRRPGVAVQNIDFGCVFFGEHRTFAANLVNNNPHSSSFSVLIMSNAVQEDKKAKEAGKGKEAEAEGEVSAKADEKGEIDVSVSPSEGQ